MEIRFVPRENGPERLACEAEIVFGPETEPLAGLKLVGFSIWEGADGDTYVTFPSRAFGAGQDRRFFDYLRAVDGKVAETKRLKAWILDQYRAFLQAA